MMENRLPTSLQSNDNRLPNCQTKSAGFVVALCYSIDYSIVNYLSKQQQSNILKIMRNVCRDK